MCVCVHSQVDVTLMLSVTRGEVGVKSTLASSAFRSSPGGRGLLLSVFLGGSRRRGLAGGSLGGGRDPCCTWLRLVVAGWREGNFHKQQHSTHIYSQ